MKESVPDGICTRCILSSSFPGIQVGNDGLCNICRSAPSIEEMAGVRQSLRESMRSAIDAGRGAGNYDCVVAYSGGKDSTFVLRLLAQEYQARCLALTVDNGFLSEQALANCNHVTTALEVDFMLVKPTSSFMNTMYQKSAATPGIHSRAAITRGSAICNSCINLINNVAVVTALEKDIPTIAGGYLGGQVPKNAAVIRIDLPSHLKARESTLKNYEENFGPAARQYFGINPTLLRRSGLSHLNVINPMLTLDVSESEIIETISSLGWIRPQDTGSQSSNCRLNDVGILIHHRQYGFNPYTAEIAEQVRYGQMPREEGLRRASSIPQASEVLQQAAQAGINLNAP
jgi:tRNA(Ile)-lysidine synthase TilS/MesJ